MKLLLIGASTGGPNKIEKIIKNITLNDCSIIIAQHMNRMFLESFASRLAKITNHPVEIAANNQKIEPNKIYLCKEKTEIVNNRFKISKSDHFNPDINTLFHSLAGYKNILGIILTGIGDDGVSGCVELKKNGAICYTETANSAIVDGMPKQAREAGIEAMEFEEIIKKVREFCQKR